jgi:hypothetical protein
MNLENGGTFYIEARIDGRVRIWGETNDPETYAVDLSIEECRTAARALLLAATEAEDNQKADRSEKYDANV